MTLEATTPLDTQLTAHFTLREFARSQTAARMGRSIDIPPAIAANLRHLATTILQPLRSQLGRPITILSGYRPPWLNTAVGGSKNSEHMHGRAADLLIAGLSTYAGCQAILDLGLPFNQLIHEFPPTGWIHVSTPPPGHRPRLSAVTAIKQAGKTTYLQGIRAL